MFKQESNQHSASEEIPVKHEPAIITKEILSRAIKTQGHQKRLEFIDTALRDVAKEITPSIAEKYVNPELVKKLDTEHIQEIEEKAATLLLQLDRSPQKDQEFPPLLFLEQEALKHARELLLHNYVLDEQQEQTLHDLVGQFHSKWEEFLEQPYARLLGVYGGLSRTVKKNSAFKQYENRFQQMRDYYELIRELSQNLHQLRRQVESEQYGTSIATASGGELVIERNIKHHSFETMKKRVPIVVLSDSHGSDRAIRESLYETGILPDAGSDDMRLLTERAKETIVVIAGDIFDRGQGGMKTLELAHKLDEAGVRTIVLEGNHESIIEQVAFETISDRMLHGWLFKQGGLETLRGLDHPLLSTLLPDIIKFGDYLTTVDEENIQHKKAIKTQLAQILRETVFQGVQGEVFKNMKLVEQIGDVMVAHSEFSPQIAYLAAVKGIDHLNALRQELFAAAVAPQATDHDRHRYHNFLVKTRVNGILWSRAFSEEKIPYASGTIGFDDQEIRESLRLLKARGVNVYVCGHTPELETLRARYHASGSEGTQLILELEGVKLIFADIAMSPGVHQHGDNPQSGAVMITPELAQKNAIGLFNPIQTPDGDHPYVHRFSG